MENGLEQTLEALTFLLRQTVTGKCAIALAGAHAKGTADGFSDIDLYVYAEDCIPYAARKRLIAEFADSGRGIYVSEGLHDAPWGGAMDFTYRGTPVEVATRSLGEVERMVQESLAGRFEIFPATWTSNGYYTFIYLSEFQFIQPLYDPDGILAEYKRRTEAYPEALRRGILRTFLERAGTWMDNFHYESAVRRSDILFAAPIVLHTVLDMLQVVFALNRTYFPGDKKLEAALAGLKRCPEALRTELDFLLRVSRDVREMERQRQLLHQIYWRLSAWVEQALSE